MHNVIQPAPRFMAQTPVFVAGTAEAGDAISGVVDGDLILHFAWDDSSTAPSTPSGYTSVYSSSVSGLTGGFTRNLSIRISKKTASSESGNWPGTSGGSQSTLIAWVRNATAVGTIGVLAGDGGETTSYNMVAITPSNAGIIFAPTGSVEAYFNDSGLNYSSAFNSWSATKTATYSPPPSGGRTPWSKLKYKKVPATSSGTPAFTGNGNNLIAGMLISVY